jgi:hypothetical protein
VLGVTPSQVINGATSTGLFSAVVASPLAHALGASATFATPAAPSTTSTTFAPPLITPVERFDPAHLAPAFSALTAGAAAARYVRLEASKHPVPAAPDAHPLPPGTGLWAATHIHTARTVSVAGSPALRRLKAAGLPTAPGF